MLRLLLALAALLTTPATFADSPLSATAHRTPSAPGLNVRDFAARGDGATDDTPAFRAALAACLEQSRALIIPAGDYRITGKLTCWKWTKERGRGSIPVSGEGPRATRILFEPESPNTVLFEHAEWFVVKNLAVERAGGDTAEPAGIAFATPARVQSAFSSYENIRVKGFFKYAWFNAFTMHDQWRNVQSHGPCCHFMFALSSDFDHPLTPPQTGWNSGPTGWFHNLGTLDGVICDGGEVGLAGAVMQFHLVQFTAQGQRTAGGARNRILPTGAPGTGILLAGPAPTAHGSLRGNSLGALYFEATERPLAAVNAGVIRASSLFVQGSSAPGGFPVAIELDNTRLALGALTTRQPFARLASAKNKSLLTVELLDGRAGPVAADASSRIRLDTAAAPAP